MHREYLFMNISHVCECRPPDANARIARQNIVIINLHVGQFIMNCQTYVELLLLRHPIDSS